jgi:hypothetical protein
MARPIVAGMGCAACDDIRDHDVYGGGGRGLEFQIGGYFD